MMRSFSRLFASLVAASLIGITGGDASAQSLAYSMEDMEGLIESGVTPQRIVELAMRSCLAFELDAASIGRLQRAGATPALLASLREVCSPGRSVVTNVATPSVQAVSYDYKEHPTLRSRRIAEDVLLARQLSAGVFRVVGNEVGLGFLVDSTGMILTHAQLLRFGDQVSVQIDASTRLAAVVLDLDEVRDVAVLGIDMSRCKGCRPLRLFMRNDPEPVILHERLLAVGWPADTIRFARVGLVREVRQTDILTDITPDNVSTGGPIVNLDGEVVAIGMARVVGLPGRERVSRALLVRELEFTLARATEVRRSPAFHPPSDALLPLLGPPTTANDRAAAEADTIPWARTTVDAGPFTVTVMTPSLMQRREREAQLELAQRHAAGRHTPGGLVDGIQLWHGWEQFVRSGLAAVVVSVTPAELPVPFRDPELVRAPHRGDFARMQLFRNGTELLPVERSRFPALLAADELRAVKLPVAYQGLQIFLPEDFIDADASFEAHIWEAGMNQPVRVALPPELLAIVRQEFVSLR